MSVSGLSANSALYADWQTNFSKIKSDFSALAKALKSGDLSSAQSAFSWLQKDRASNSNSSTSSTSQADPFSALASALQSGDLSSAQTAFSTLQHSHRQPPPNARSDSTDSTSGSTTTSSSSNPFSALSQALESGDLSAAKTAFADLLKNLPSPPPPDDSSDSSTSIDNASSTSGSASTTTNAASSSSSTTSSDPLSILSTALQSGDLAPAQAAFSQLQAPR